MSTASKYTFDIEFRPEGDLVSNAARARQKKAYSTDEIDLLSAKAREQGMKSGQVRAIEAQTLEIAALTEILRNVLAQSSKAADEVRREASLLALAAARKLAAAALEMLPAADVEEALRHALHQAQGEPRVVLHASPRVAELLKARLAEIAHEEGFEGRVVVTGEAALGNADCRIEWRGGGAECSEKVIEAAIADAIARRFSNQSSAED
ncbi:MAG TPA: FliH/SctL family protein [Rhizomicrobium sp.]|jgi:flagellar assembly protein FliH|nr:FliH/SctL family protein [Rhizomicrobium sp.]